MEEIEEVKEAEIKEETALVKPEFKGDIKAEITGIQKIEDNIKEVNKYALELANYYDSIIFSEEETKIAKKEMAEINKFKDKVSRFRIDIEKQWKKPLEIFTTTAKETEKSLKDTYDKINVQIENYEDSIKREKKDEVKSYFDELCLANKIDFVGFDKANINVTLSASLKSLKEQAKEFVDKIVDDIKLINSQQYVDEMIIEYKKSLNVLKTITDVNNRHAELERAQQEKQEKKQDVLTDEAMLNKIESLSAPEVEKQDEIVLLAFEFIGPKESAKIIANTLKSIEGKYRQLMKVEDHYE